jgi:ATPase subunit of ABC transporter with duplicated ATPase domains
LAKRITQTKKPTDYNYEIVNQADVRLPVVDKFYATNDTDAQKVYSQWLKSKDLPDDTADYGYRKVTAKPAEEPPWVAQNFDSARDSATLQANLQNQPTGDYSAFERNSDRIDAIRAGQDATEVRRNWEFVDRITGRVVNTVSNASYNQANAVQADVERRYPNADIYLRSVERSN